jgi:hypothetical protein
MAFVIEPALGAWWDYSWTYRKAVTINHAKVASDLSSFAVLVDVTDADLASKALSNGYDVAFADSSGNKLDHEIEKYESASGHLVAWVRLPTLSASVDTVFYMYYGNPSALNQQNPAGVWDSSFRMVQHLKESSGTCYDSAGNHNDGTPYGGVSQGVSGKTDGAAGFDGSNDYVDVGSASSLDDLNQITISAWIKVNSLAATIYDKGWTSGKSFYFHPDGLLCFVQGFTSGSPNPYGWWKTSAALAIGTWYYVAVTYDSGNSGNNPGLYINGASVAVTEGNMPIGTSLSDASYNGQVGGKVSYANGVIDDVRVSATMRSAVWISTEYNNQLSPSTFYTVGSEEVGTVPQAPQFTLEYPKDGSSNVPLNPALSVHAVDFQGDFMAIVFSTNASGAWAELGRYTNVGNGTYNQTTINMNNYSTKYYWNVSATDGTNWTNRTYTFTTVPIPPPWWNPLWLYRKSIAVDHTKVAGDLSNFPVLVDVTDADLASKARSDGADIAFADLSGSKMDHEIERFDSVNGHLVAWVRLPVLSSTGDTVFYMYYGDPSASNQQNPSGVWDSSFSMVQHLKETSGTCYDSTANHNDGTPGGGVSQAVTGKIDGAAAFDGNNGTCVDVGSKPSVSDINTVTITAWVRANSWPSYIFDKGFTNGKGFYIHDSGWLSFVQGFSTQYGWWHTSDPATVSKGSWHYVCVTYDSTDSGNDPVLYIDAVPMGVTEGRTPNGAPSSDAGYEAFISCNQTELGSRTMNGTVDEVRLSSLIRSTAWIQTEYNNQLSPTTFCIFEGEEVGTLPQAPWLANEAPHDGSTDVALNPTLSVQATDFQGDLMTIIFSTNASGAWAELGRYTNVGNGTYTGATVDIGSYSTMYHWKVCSTDGANWENRTFSFTTRPANYPPSISNPSPQDGAISVQLDPTLSIYAADGDNDALTVISWTNTSGLWQIMGTKTGYNGTYSQASTNMDSYTTKYYWRACVSDGKSWSNRTFSFTTRGETDYFTQIGFYSCAGMPYMGEDAYDKDVFHIIWFGNQYVVPWPPHGRPYLLWNTEFDKGTGWVNPGTYPPDHNYSSWLMNWNADTSSTGCEDFAYFGGEYHIFWTELGTGRLATAHAANWSDFQSMGSHELLEPFQLYSGSDAWGSTYAFNNSYAWKFYVLSDPIKGNTICYWTWNETGGWSPMTPMWSTSTGSTGEYPHDCAGAVLLPINRTTWYIYYKSNIGGEHYNIMKSFDAGQTWTAPAIASGIPEQINTFRSHRPNFVRYGDNFYLIVNQDGEDISCWNSTDGEHWGNLQTIHSGTWYVPRAIMLDQSHLLWTASDINWIYPDPMRTGKIYGGVYKIPEMIATPGKPSNPYPLNGALLPEGTLSTRLQVTVHGSQTYDVAFYWANGTFIDENKLLREGETASVEVSGLKKGELYSWYAISRGTTYEYWGHEPRTTSDENRSDVFVFALGMEPELVMDPSQVTCRKKGELYTVQINITNALSVNGFEFEIGYNSTLFDYAAISWGTFLDGAKIIDNIDPVTGIIQGHVGISSPANGGGWLLTLTFSANKTLIWKDCPGWLNELDGAVWFHSAQLDCSGDLHFRYEEWAGGKREITVGQVRYSFVPLQGDVDNDGDVEIFDLRSVTAFYLAKSGDPNWSTASTYDLNGDGRIDIIDLIIVAVKFGTTYNGPP